MQGSVIRIERWKEWHVGLQPARSHDAGEALAVGVNGQCLPSQPSHGCHDTSTTSNPPTVLSRLSQNSLYLELFAFSSCTVVEPTL